MNRDLLHYMLLHFSYLGILLWFMLIEQLTPIPEEVSLMSLGYLCRQTNLNPILGGIVALAGLLVTDNALFFFSRKGSRLTQRLEAKLKPAWRQKIKNGLDKNAAKTLFISALLPKFRFLSPIIAASMGVTWKLFIWIDAGATLFYVTVYMLMGMLFHRQLTLLLLQIEQAGHLIFCLLMLIISLAITRWVRRYLIRRRMGETGFY